MTPSTAPELNRLLQDAFDRQASDLHLVAGEPPIYRIGGRLVRADQPPLTGEDLQRLAVATAGETQVQKLGPEQGHIVTHCGIEGVVSGRLCLTRAAGHCTVSIRLLPTRLGTVEQARIPEALLEAMTRPQGLVICSGPSGCGKTTTALILLDHLNATRPVNILTLEDPLDYRLTPKQAIIRQQEVGVDTPSYAAGLRAALAQDPDVLFVGEVRDLVTLGGCVTAAQTGHLVLTQLHARTPEAAIQKMIDVHAPEVQPPFRHALAEVLLAVSCQALLPNASGHGRVPAYSVLTVDPELRDALAQGCDLTTRKTPRPKGWRTFAEDLEMLVGQGLITAQAAEACRGQSTM